MEILHVLHLISILNEPEHYNTQSGVNSQGNSVPKYSSQELSTYYDISYLNSGIFYPLQIIVQR